MANVNLSPRSIPSHPNDARTPLNRPTAALAPSGRGVRLLTSQEAARFLRIPLNTLYQLRSKGEAPRAVRIGRRVQYKLSDLEAYVDEHYDVGGAA